MAKKNPHEHCDYCDCCGKFVPFCNLFTLDEELYPLLHGDNEFSICSKCHKSKTIEDWKKWIPIKRSMRLKKETGLNV
jgi:hypothetical protein